MPLAVVVKAAGEKEAAPLAVAERAVVEAVEAATAEAVVEEAAVSEEAVKALSPHQSHIPTAWPGTARQIGVEANQADR